MKSLVFIKTFFLKWNNKILFQGLWWGKRKFEQEYLVPFPCNHLYLMKAYWKIWNTTENVKLAALAYFHTYFPKQSCPFMIPLSNIRLEKTKGSSECHLRYYWEIVPKILLYPKKFFLVHIRPFLLFHNFRLTFLYAFLENLNIPTSRMCCL